MCFSSEVHRSIGHLCGETCMWMHSTCEDICSHHPHQIHEEHFKWNYFKNPRVNDLCVLWKGVFQKLRNIILKSSYTCNVLGGFQGWLNNIIGTTSTHILFPMGHYCLGDDPELCITYLQKFLYPDVLYRECPGMTEGCTCPVSDSKCKRSDESPPRDCGLAAAKMLQSTSQLCESVRRFHNEYFCKRGHLTRSLQQSY